jgi:hypothetical protein
VPSRGRTEAGALVASLAARAAAGQGDLRELVRTDPAFATIAAEAIDAAFDVDRAAREAGSLAASQLERLARSPHP